MKRRDELFAERTGIGSGNAERENPLEKVGTESDEEVSAQDVVETGKGPPITGDAWPGLLTGDRRLSIEQIVDADPEAGVVGEIPNGSQIDVVSFPEIHSLSLIHI